jgi:uncharacterized protein YegP (UPF0339 family)
MSTPRFEYWQSEKDGLWYWHLKAANGEIVQHSEAYKRRAGALQGIAAAKRAAAIAVVVERRGR